MAEFELICLVLMLVAVLDIAACKIHAPYPVVMVLSGLGLSLIPGLPRVGFNPELVLMVFLPPLLYPAAFFTSWRDFWRSVRPITLMATGLVLATMLAVACVAHAVIPNLPWAAAFVLGAVVSPTDAIAAAAVLKRIKVPRPIVTVLEGESLVNDAAALVAYRFGIAAAVTGSFSLQGAAIQFPLVALGGVAIGWLVATVMAWIQSRLDDAPVQVTLSLITPFVAYLPAEQFGYSGVLAVVTAGLLIGWRLPQILTARTRLESASFWRMLVYLLNGVIFIFIGLQLPRVVSQLGYEPRWNLILYAIEVSLTVVLVRMIWVFSSAYFPRWLFWSARAPNRYPDWRHVMIVGWAGMRGVVSLAAAMALPFTTATATPFPGRDHIIFLSFCVILVTLVAQGLTLPILVRFLDVKGDVEADNEERCARLKANKAGLAYLEALDSSDSSGEQLQRLQSEYHDRIAQLEDQSDADDSGSASNEIPASSYRHMQHAALQVERHTIIDLRNKHYINDDTLRIVQRDLDLAEARLIEAEA